MKESTAVCKKCGKVKISGTWTDSNEEAFMVPTILAPTIQVLGRAYSQYAGEKFERATGEKISNAFEKKTISLSHKSIDEPDWEEHMMEPLEVWSLIV